MKRYILPILFTLCGLANINATPLETPAATDYQIGTMWNVAANKQLGRFNLMLQQSVFTLDTSLERAMTIVGCTFNIIPQYLRVQVLGIYLYHQGDDDCYYNRWRYHAGINGAVPINAFSLSWATRLESTYTIGSDINVNKLRSKMQCAYKIPETKFQPFIGIENFLMLNTANSGQTDRMWYDIGFNYFIDKNNSIEFLIREENRIISSPKEWNTHISFTYKIVL